jgi:biopolymer transport protein TolR
MLEVVCNELFPMSRPSMRERRLQKQARKNKGMTLNIVSLIDIFTVLVFFLLLNSTELELLPSVKNIQLPESVAEAKAGETVVVMVSRDDILFQGQPVAKVQDVIDSKDRTIPALQQALEQSLLHPTASATTSANTPPVAVTIMGDREIPYRLLRKVLATCANTDYAQLSLAVSEKVMPHGQAASGQTISGFKP